MIDNRKNCLELPAVRNYSDFTYTLYELTQISISGIRSKVQTIAEHGAQVGVELQQCTTSTCNYIIKEKSSFISKY